MATQHFFILLILSLWLTLDWVRAQSETWDFSFSEYVLEEIPLWKAVDETEKKGFWDLGDGRSVKAVVFELGGCSRGHPCASATGIPYVYPEGCDTSKCIDRFPGDPWRQYDWNCPGVITPDTIGWQQSRFGNITQLSTEWFNLFDTSCVLRYLPDSDTWEQGETGVAIVLRTQGFSLPSQTVIVSDIDSVDEFLRFFWPDIQQEASINFAMRNGTLLKPRNRYAADFYDSDLLINSRPTVSVINVTLTQEFLDALDIGAQSTWVPASLGALTSDKVFDYVEFQMPEHYRDAAGGSVWAEITSEFDTWVSAMSVGRKSSDDRDQRLNVNPLKAIKRCKCSMSEGMSLVARPTSVLFACTAQLVATKTYVCDESGGFICNEVRFTAWDKTGDEGTDGTVACSPKNSTKVVRFAEVSSIATADWSSWPSSAHGPSTP